LDFDFLYVEIHSTKAFFKTKLDRFAGGTFSANARQLNKTIFKTI